MDFDFLLPLDYNTAQMINSEVALSKSQQKKLLYEVGLWLRVRGHTGTTVGETLDVTKGRYPADQIQGALNKLTELKQVDTEADPRGRASRVRYKVSDDPEQYRAFCDELDGFVHSERLRRAGERKPKTIYYQRGLRVVRKAERKHDSFGITIDETTAQKAEDNLKLGKEVETLVDEGLDTVQAKYDEVLVRLQRVLKPHS